MSLVLRKGEGSWLEAAKRQAKEHGLEEYVAAEYEQCIAAGFTEEQAAWSACYEYDILDFVNEPFAELTPSPVPVAS